MRSDDELMAIVDKVGWLRPTNPEPTEEAIMKVLGDLTSAEIDRLMELLKQEHNRRLQKLARIDQLAAAIKNRRNDF
jgi:hypothetical protein